MALKGKKLILPILIGSAVILSTVSIFIVDNVKSSAKYVTSLSGVGDTKVEVAKFKPELKYGSSDTSTWQASIDLVTNTTAENEATFTTIPTSGDTVEFGKYTFSVKNSGEVSEYIDITYTTLGVLPLEINVYNVAPSEVASATKATATSSGSYTESFSFLQTSGSTTNFTFVINWQDDGNASIYSGMSYSLSIVVTARQGD